MRRGGAGQSLHGPFYTETQLATNGAGDFPNYRIPALTVTNEGDVLASYDGRPTGMDSPGPNSILQRRSTDNGQSWEPVTTVAAGHTGTDQEGYSDPSYVVDRVTGDVFNFHVHSMDVGFHGSQPGTDPDDRNVLHANVSHSPTAVRPGPSAPSPPRSPTTSTGAAGSPPPGRGSS